MKRTLSEFARLCEGKLAGADRGYTSVSTDTRTLTPGALYLALRGPRFDGNEFVAAAAQAGAAGAVVDRPVVAAALPLISVADGQAALSRAAAAWRSQYPGTVIGVAGSNGKTTTKEMTAAILARLGPCLATRGNLNNHIGVPLTLLRLEPTDRYAVVEMGANRAGDVAGLVAIAQPQVGLITNAGAEHLEGFGDMDGVARAEGEMVAGLSPDGVAVINADDAYAGLWREMTPARVVTFGIESAADFRATDIREDFAAAGFAVTFTLVAPGGRETVRLNVGGRHNVLNALAAAAATCSAGASLADVSSGLAQMQPVQGRLQPKLGRNGARIIDDSYNANPSSVRAGIDVVTHLPGCPWMVLGDMGELGDHSAQLHADIGRYAFDHGVRRLFATGSQSRLAAEAFGAGATWHPDVEALAQAVEAELSPDVCLLIKGSRSNRLERVVAALTGQQQEKGH